jgi:hypothetical protein
MTLTVPRAGSIAGRSANIVAAPNQTGEIVAEFANRLTSIGLGLEEDRLSRQANRLQVDMMRDFNNLSLELQSIGDPDTLDQTWTQRSQQLREAYTAAAGEDGRPRVDPQNLERFNLAFDEMASRSAFTIGARALELRQSQRRATLDTLEQEIAVASPTLAPEDAQVFWDIYQTQLDEGVATGIFTPEEANDRMMRARAGDDDARLTALLDVDPEAAREFLDNGGFPNLGPGARAAAAVQANNIIAARQEEADRLNRQSIEERDRQNAATLTEVISIVGKGGVPANLRWIDDPAFQTLPEYREAMAALSLAEAAPSWRQLPLSELDRMIEERRQTPMASAWEAEELDLLTATRDAARQGWTTDPIAYAQEVGLPVPPLELQGASFEQLQSQLGQRQAFAQQLIEEGYRTEANTVALTVAEREQLRGMAAIGQPAEQRVAVVAAAYSALRSTGADTADQIFDDPVTRYMGSQIFAGAANAQDVAVRVFRGQEVLEAQGIDMPARTDQLGPAGLTLGTVFADLEGGPAAAEATILATNALYALERWGANPDRAANWTGDIDTRAYRQAMHSVLGGTGTFDSANARGGIQDVNGRSTILPPGIRAQDVTEALYTVAVRDTSPALDIYSAANRADAAVIVRDRLARLSPSGQPPREAMDPRFRSDLSTGAYVVRAVPSETFQSTLYELGRYDANGDFAVFYGADGEPWRFDMTRLLAEAGP